MSLRSLLKALWFALVSGLSWPLAACAQGAQGTQAAQAAQAAQGPAGVAVSVPSLDLVDMARGEPVALKGTWFAANVSADAPAVVLLHGCGGLFDRQRLLAERYTRMAAFLNLRGIHALTLDSLSPRGERELCTQKTGERRITMVQRRRDALGALVWLAAQPGVDRQRLGLLGWSNGGSTVLASINLKHREVAAAAVQPAFAIAYYPGCEADLKRGFAPSVPLLMLLGEADDWTPAAPCKALAAGAVNGLIAAPQWKAYEGAYHGFDGTDALRLRRDVPNGANPGQGVHVGSDAAAREASLIAVDEFLRQQLAQPR